MANQRRVHKVAEKIRSLIAMDLFNLADPRFELVTITSVVLTEDLRYAKIYWTTLNTAWNHEEVLEAFTKARGHFKQVLAKELGIRFVPDLKFFYDDTLETEAEINRLLSKVSTGEGNIA